MYHKWVAFAAAAAFLGFVHAPAAHATDGVVLINQTTALRGLPGCPLDGGELVVICQPGSYRLSGNLAANGTTGISITTDNVTLDLNGFSITGTGRGSGISSNNSYITIRNGAVRSFEDGIDFNSFEASQAGEEVDSVLLADNQFAGVLISFGSALVTHCRFINNGDQFANGGGLTVMYASASTRINVLDSVFSGNRNGSMGLYLGYAGQAGVSRYGGNLISDGVSGGTSAGDNVCGNGGKC